MKLLYILLVLNFCFFLGCSTTEEKNEKFNFDPIKENREGLDYKSTDMTTEDALLMQMDGLLQRLLQAQRKQDDALAMHTERELEELSRGHFSFLIKSLNSDKSSIAAMALGFSDDIRAIPYLMEVLENGNLMTRCNAAMALGHIGSEKTPMDELTTILLREDDDDDVRAMVAFAIAQIVYKDKDFGSLSALHKVLTDKATMVRNNAVLALMRIGKKESGKNILQTTIKDEHPIVRLNSLIAIQRLCDWSTAKTAVVKTMRDPVQDVADAAFHVATMLSGKELENKPELWEEYIDMPIATVEQN